MGSEHSRRVPIRVVLQASIHDQVLLYPVAKFDGLATTLWDSSHVMVSCSKRGWNAGTRVIELKEQYRPVFTANLSASAKWYISYLLASPVLRSDHDRVRMK